ncbi:hypothetical protein [Pseudomonas sp. xss_2]|uniref:hypothetical protein n=1 Tax=Pseudomonas sp. xss_2 TaxID=3367215 RepID=UPI00370C142D
MLAWGGPPNEGVNRLPKYLVAAVAQMNREKQFRAYELLRKLDAQTATAMSQIAYGHISGAEWDYICGQHRKAFEDWMIFAATIGGPEGDV